MKKEERLEELRKAAYDLSSAIEINEHYNIDYYYRILSRHFYAWGEIEND